MRLTDEQLDAAEGVRNALSDAGAEMAYAALSRIDDEDADGLSMLEEALESVREQQADLEMAAYDIEALIAAIQGPVEEIRDGL